MIPSCDRRSTYLRGLAARTKRTPFRCRRWSSAPPSRRRTCCSSAATSAGSSSNQIKEGRRKGAWSYPGPGGDNSNSQFAVLALYDAQRVGAEVSRETWELAADYWRSTQNDDGSWGYMPGDAGTGSMTCAGIGGLAICRRRARVGRCRGRKRPRRFAAGRMKTTIIWTAAIDWLAQRFSVDRNPRPAGGGQSVLVLLSLRPGARRPAHRPPLHRRSRLVSRRRRVPGPRAGFALALLERQLVRRTRSAHQHRDGAVVPVQGPPADRHGQAQVRRRRRVEPTSPRRRQSHRVHRRSLGARPHLAGDGPGNGHGRRPAASARAVHQRQPGAELAAARARSCATTSTAAASSSPRPAAAIRSGFDGAFAN